MATYTTLDRRSIDLLLTRYDLGEILGHSPLDGGAANSSVVLTTSTGTYVLSVCDEKNRKEITSLTATLELLARHSFPTTRLVRTRDDRPFTDFQGKPVYIKRYIEGEVRKHLSPEMLRQTGAAMADLHAIAPLEFLPHTFSYGIEQFPDLFSRQGDFPAWLKAITATLLPCCRPELPTGLIHGDLFYDNILFSGETLVALLDFEEVCNSFLIFDLGMCAAGCCCVAGEFSFPATSALVAGYQERRVLTPSERESFQAHIAYGAAATAFWRYRQFNILVPTPEKQDAHLEMQRLTDTLLAIPPRDFLAAVFV